jgi:uncharacterized membrane protein YdjX (TVP38/TMEM64 family)
VWLYALASFLGTVPYFYVLAVIGHRFRLPLWLLIGAFALVIVGVAVDWLRRRRRAAGRGTTPSGAG